MTDNMIDDDFIGNSRPTSSGSNSSMSSSSVVRRPMFIETERRTDSITKRRITSTSMLASRSVYDILENTKSPTDGLPPTTYTYAHSVSYIPVMQNGSYGVPVMARRDLHADYHSYSSNTSVFSSPTRFISNVRSHLANGYSAIRNRLTHHEQQLSNDTLLTSPNRKGSAARASRTSSTTTTTTETTSTGYNLRRRPPVHSTPRDADFEENLKATVDAQQDITINESPVTNTSQPTGENLFIKLIRFPFNLINALPWWLFFPLLLFIGIFVVPQLACRPFEHYPKTKIHQQCRLFKEYRQNLTDQTLHTLRHDTFRNLNEYYHSTAKWKQMATDKLTDFYSRSSIFFRRSMTDVKDRVSNVVETTAENAKEYCDAGIQKINALIEEVKQEREKYFGHQHVLNADQEQELRKLVRHLIDEYAADETGQADYALEANGGKIVDTRCTEYTDEPRQNVVKFFGIPIVHMSKQPDIMIRAGRLPGQCFPFKGDQGSVVIKLAVPVKPTEFVVEHLSKSISIVGHINSAPNNFTVYALKDKLDKEGKVLGRYFYDAENGPSLQRFKPQLVNVPLVEYIEVRVTSNWGNPNYTCFYRFRVHGDLKTVQPPATA